MSESFLLLKRRRECRLLFAQPNWRTITDRQEGNRARRRALFFTQVHVRGFLCPIIARGTQEDINGPRWHTRRNEHLNCARGSEDASF